MKVLITGSSGRIGKAIAALLIKKHQVLGLDIKPGNYTTFIEDISDKKGTILCVEGMDAIIHCAGLLTPHVGIESEKKFWEVNVCGTENLINACLIHGVKRFVFTSTTSVYGDAMVNSKNAVWVTEELNPRPRDIYDETKLAAETLGFNASLKGLSFLSLRMSRCFPEREDLMTIYRLYRGVDERDVAKAHELALFASIKNYEVLNISCQTPFQSHDIVDLYGKADQVIKKYFPWAEEEFFKRGWIFPRVIDRVYVIDKAKKILGYNPSYNFSECFKFDTEAKLR